MSRLVVRIDEATDTDVSILAKHIRCDDRREIELSHGVTNVKAAIAHSVRVSDSPLAGWVGDKLICIWGVERQSLITNMGVPWMLATSAIREYPLVFAKGSKDWLNFIKFQYTYLHNHVHNDNELSIRWLKWLGFTLDEVEPFGPYKAPFRKFHMRGELQCVHQQP